MNSLHKQRGNFAMFPAGTTARSFAVAFIPSSGWAVLDEIPAPADARVIVEIRVNGDIFIDRLNGVSEVVGTWVTGEGWDPNDYDFQWSRIGNDPNWGPSEAVNTWINGLPLSWGEEETGTGVNIASGNLQIRKAGGGATLASAGISLNVDTT